MDFLSSLPVLSPSCPAASALESSGPASMQGMLSLGSSMAVHWEPRAGDQASQAGFSSHGAQGPAQVTVISNVSSVLFPGITQKQIE